MWRSGRIGLVSRGRFRLPCRLCFGFRRGLCLRFRLQTLTFSLFRCLLATFHFFELKLQTRSHLKFQVFKVFQVSPLSIAPKR